LADLALFPLVFSPSLEFLASLQFSPSLADLALFPLVLAASLASFESLVASSASLAASLAALAALAAALAASCLFLQHTYAFPPSLQYIYVLLHLSAPSPSITHTDYVLLRQASPHTLQMYIYFIFTGSYLI
jgi:hypothetical protein